MQVPGDCTSHSAGTSKAVPHLGLTTTFQPAMVGFASASSSRAGCPRCARTAVGRSAEAVGLGLRVVGRRLLVARRRPGPGSPVTPAATTTAVAATIATIFVRFPPPPPGGPAGPPVPARPTAVAARTAPADPSAGIRAAGTGSAAGTPAAGTRLSGCRLVDPGCWYGFGSCGFCSPPGGCCCPGHMASNHRCARGRGATGVQEEPLHSGRTAPKRPGPTTFDPQPRGPSESGRVLVEAYAPQDLPHRRVRDLHGHPRGPGERPGREAPSAFLNANVADLPSVRHVPVLGPRSRSPRGPRGSGPDTTAATARPSPRRTPRSPYASAGDPHRPAAADTGSPTALLAAWAEAIRRSHRCPWSGLATRG